MTWEDFKPEHVRERSSEGDAWAARGANSLELQQIRCRHTPTTAPTGPSVHRPVQAARLAMAVDPVTPWDEEPQSECDDRDSALTGRCGREKTADENQQQHSDERGQPACPHVIARPRNARIDDDTCS